MSTFPKAQRPCSTPQLSRIPMFKNAKYNNVIDPLSNPSPFAHIAIKPDQREQMVTPPLKFDASSTAGHTPHPSSMESSPQTIVALQVHTLIQFFRSRLIL